MTQTLMQTLRYTQCELQRHSPESRLNISNLPIPVDMFMTSIYVISSGHLEHSFLYFYMRDVQLYCEI